MRILVACVGNIFLGDDGFGVEVARRLAARPLPEGVRLVDFGIRGMDLAYALLEGWAGVVLVDAAPRGKPAGTLSVLEVGSGDAAAAAGASAIEPHAMDPAKVLAHVEALGGRVERLRVVCCEPAPVADLEEMAAGLSEPVAAALEPAVELVLATVEDLRAAIRGA
jgi:hydrogenase maturation protease